MLLLPGIAYADETLSEKCTSDAASSHRGEGDRKVFLFDVENTCDFRIRCELNIAILNAYGLNVDHKTVTIEPKAHGSLILWIKVPGGMSTRRHTCTQL
jgi:hypothetical protein